MFVVVCHCQGVQLLRCATVDLRRRQGVNVRKCECARIRMCEHVFEFFLPIARDSVCILACISDAFLVHLVCISCASDVSACVAFTGLEQLVEASHLPCQKTGWYAGAAPRQRLLCLSQSLTLLKGGNPTATFLPHSPRPNPRERLARCLSSSPQPASYVFSPPSLNSL